MGPARGRAELLTWIDGDPSLRAIAKQAEDRLSDDPGHDLSHALRVALWTLRIGDRDVDPREAVAAALLHDVVNLPKDHPARAEASGRSAEVASEILATADFSPEARARICDAIRDHSYSRGARPTSDLGRALQDADRLEALGAIGIFRTISTGVRMGAAYFHPEDPWASARPLDDVAHSVDHFFTKLLKLPATMNTPAGRREANHRAATMRDLLHQLGHELGLPSPVTGGED